MKIIKHFGYIAVVLLSLPIFSSCHNKVDLIEEGHDIPVVYGFIDLADTAQYLRVMRVFGEEDKSALKLAKTAEEIYYNDAEVSLSWADNVNSVLLTKVDGNKEGYKRDTGALLEAPNYLYKIKTDALNLKGGESLILHIRRQGAEIGKSKINVLRPFSIRTPSDLEVTWHGRAPLSIKWLSTPFAKVYDVKLVFHISEHNLSNGDWSNRELSWVAIRGQRRRGGSRLYERASITSGDMYRYLSGVLTEDRNIERVMTGLDITVYAGGQEFVDFQQVLLANIGLTGALELPLFSNIDGGLGVFAGKYHVETKGHLLSGASIDSLRMNRLTSKLNFTK